MNGVRLAMCGHEYHGGPGRPRNKCDACTAKSEAARPSGWWEALHYDEKWAAAFEDDAA